MKTLLNIVGTSLLVLIFLALFVPITYQEIKIVFLLLALTGVVVLGIYSKKLIWSERTLMACFLLATFGLVNSLHGELNSAPGAFRVLTVMTVWPILFAILSTMLNRPNAIRMLIFTLTITLLVLVAYSFLFLGNMSGVVPDALYFELDQGQAIGFYDGTVEYSLHSISSLLFLIPFWVHYLLILNRTDKAKIIHWIVLFVGLFLCVLTGRRAVQLVVLMSPFIVMATEAMVGSGLRRGLSLFKFFFIWRYASFLIIGAIGLTFVFASIEIRLDALVEEFMLGFNFSEFSSAVERVNQFYSLINSWFNGNLLIGAGNGSHTDYLRSAHMPWAYELSYVYLLFSTGVVGVLFYFGWFGWGLMRIRNALIYRPDMRIYVLPLITGVFGLAIGAASNPYFQKFDYLWILLLPHLLAGAVKHQRKHVTGKYVRAA